MGLLYSVSLKFSIHSCGYDIGFENVRVNMPSFVIGLMNIFGGIFSGTPGSGTVLFFFLCEYGI